MSNPMDSEENDRAEEYVESRVGSFVLVMAVLFPATVVAYVFYRVVMRWARQRFLVALLVGAVLTVVDAVALRGALAVFPELTINNAVTAGFWWSVLVVYCLAAAPLGLLAGLVVYGSYYYTIRTSPHLREVPTPTDWRSTFVFRRSPWEYFKYRAKLKRLRAGDANTADGTALGIEDRMRDIDDITDEIVIRTNAQKNLGTLLVGGTGAGKTTTILTQVYNELNQGSDSHHVIIDLKGDNELAATLAKWCSERGIGFYHFAPGGLRDYDVPFSPGIASYDPLAAGGAQRAGTIVGMRVWSDASDLYRNLTMEYLNSLFSLIEVADPAECPSVVWDQGGVALVKSATDKVAFEELVNSAQGTRVGAEAVEVLRKLKRNSSGGMGDQIGHVAGMMRTLLTSAYGDHMVRNSVDANHIDLAKLTEDGAPQSVILFSISSGADRELGRYFGSLILNDLARVMDIRQRTGQKNPLYVYVDEFQVVPVDFIKPLIEKGRSARIYSLWAAQSLEHIATASSEQGEAYLNAVIDTVSCFIICAGSSGTSGERAASIAGKDYVPHYRRTNANQTHVYSLNFLNRKNNLVGEELREGYVTPPAWFTNLSIPTKDNGWKATAVYMVKGAAPKPRRRFGGAAPLARSRGGVWARKVRLVPVDAVLEEVYTIEARRGARARNVAEADRLEAEARAAEDARAGVKAVRADGGAKRRRPRKRKKAVVGDGGTSTLGGSGSVSDIRGPGDTKGNIGEDRSVAVGAGSSDNTATTGVEAEPDSSADDRIPIVINELYMGGGNPSVSTFQDFEDW